MDHARRPQSHYHPGAPAMAYLRFTAAIFILIGSSMSGLPALLIVALVFTGTGICLSRARGGRKA